MRRGLGAWGLGVGLCLGLIAGLLPGCAPRAMRGGVGGTEPVSVTSVPLTGPLPAPLEEGTASYYAERFAGRPTASGEALDQTKLTAAHPSLPFGTCLRVVNLENQRSVEVRVNDRGPFAKGRVVDVSLAAARRLGLVEQGLARVRLYRCEPRAE